MEWWRWTAQGWRTLGHAGKLAVLLIAAFPTFIGIGLLDQAVEPWWAKRQQAQRQEELRERLKTVGADATLAGGLLYNAWKQCRVIGVPDIDSCAKQTGPLLQEQAAATVAEGSVPRARCQVLPRNFESLWLAAR